MADCGQGAQAARSAHEAAAMAAAFHTDPSMHMMEGDEDAAMMAEAEGAEAAMMTELFKQMSMQQEGGEGGEAEWARAFAANMQMHGGPPPLWADQFHGQNQQQHMAIDTSVEEVAWADADMENAMKEAEAQNETAEDWIQQLRDQGEGEDWAEEYNHEGVKTFGLEGEEIVSVEQKTKESKFYDFMGKVKKGEIVIEESDKGTSSALRGLEGEGDLDGAWNEAAKEALRKQEGLEAMDDDEEALGMDPLSNAWKEAGGDTDTGEFKAEEFLEAMKKAEAEAGNVVMNPADGDWATEYKNHGEYEDYEAAWEEGGGDAADWMEEYKAMTEKIKNAAEGTDYPFEENNPYLFHDTPFDEGQELAAAGTLSEAVLAFEAACQKEPERVEAWQFLGTSQAENEKDRFAIKALNKARQLCPSNQAVHMALASCHTNEANFSSALQSLKAWLLASDKYAGLEAILAKQNQSAPQMMDDSEDHFAMQYMNLSPQEHHDVVALFLAAAELEQGDADVQIGLGVLRHLQHDYKLAAEHFKHALDLRPDDEKLWNKYGATLANGSNCEEAIAAYERALDINPGFVRCHYNLGIAHGNLGRPTLAAKQFVRAIQLQQGDDGNDKSHRTTQEMWDVLRMNLNLMDRKDLVELTWKSEIGPFLKEFNIAPM